MPKNHKSLTDWEAIERNYLAGELSLRAIASAHGVSEGAIRKRAKAEGWKRTIPEKPVRSNEYAGTQSGTQPDDAARINGKNTRHGTPPVEHQFKPGNPGRPKGARNRLGEAFIEDMLAAWESQGPSAIHRVIDKRPQDFLKVVASLMPKDLNVNVNQIGEMTDEQLLDRIRKLDATIKPFLDTHGANGTGDGDSQKTTH